MMKKYTISILTLITCLCLLFVAGCGGGGAENAIEDSAFTIGYNANGAESGSAPAVQSGNGKEVLSVKANTGNLAKGGYLFDGWNTSADGSGSDYAPGALYNGKNIILFAKWAAIFNYNVINPGSPAPALDGVQRSPSFPYASITGLTAKGKTLSNINIPDIIDGYTVSSIGDNAFQNCSNITEIAIPDTVTDIGNNAFNGCANLSEVTMQGTTPPSVGTDAFTGCVLLAVTVPQSAAAAYNSNPGWSVVTIVSPGTFCISYSGNGSDGGIVPLKQVGMTGFPIQVYGNTGDLTRAGCSFNNWNTKPDGTGNRFEANASYAGPDNLALYAQWTHPDYTVTFDDQGADIQRVSPSTIKVIAPANTIGELPATPPKRNGYSFVGWNTQLDGEGDSFAVGSQVISDKTVYAKWYANDCIISYVGNGATSGSAPDRQDVSFNQVITLRSNTGNLKQDGYSFCGWNTKADGSGTDYAEGASYTVFGDATLYSKWLPLLTVTYDSNGATSGSVPVAQQGINDEQITLRSNTGDLKRDGYRFCGWNTKADGSGTDYSVGASYSVTGDAILYAKWLLLYTITYDSNQATSGSVPPAQQGVYGEQINIQSNIGNLTRTEFEFGGWNIKADGSGADYVVGKNYTITGDITLFVKWDSIYCPYAEVAVGDIVLSNGAAITPSNFTTYVSHLSSAGITPVGVIAFENSYRCMVGLKQSSLAWAKKGTSGCNISFSTNQTDGLGNWNVIKATDPTGSTDAATNYPAFNFANTYGNTFCPNSVFSNSIWYIPSLDFKGITTSGELFLLYRNRTTINNTMTILNNAGIEVALITDDFIWSSSQGDSRPEIASIIGKDCHAANFTKYSSAVVRVICRF